jgi:cellobiose phosphorylase
MLQRPEEVSWARGHLTTLDHNLERHAWDGEWFLRAYRADGLKFGSKENDEASIFLEPQPWAVYSGHSTGRRAEEIMNVVNRRLSTDYGLMICDPPVEKTDPKVIKARLFNKGMKENASVFCHTQGWAIIAEAMLGRGSRAYDYYRRFMPAACNRKAEIREIEPYVYCQFTNSKYSPRHGASRLPWLSGSASWATQYILGIQPEYTGLRIDPCIPGEWKKLTITRRFRNKYLNITIRNESGVEKGVRKIEINGREIAGNLIPVGQMEEQNEVLVIMG